MFLPWRSEADSNRCTRFCRPLPSHSAIRPLISVPRPSDAPLSHSAGSLLRRPRRPIARIFGMFGLQIYKKLYIRQNFDKSLALFRKKYYLYSTVRPDNGGTHPRKGMRRSRANPPQAAAKKSSRGARMRGGRKEPADALARKAGRAPHGTTAHWRERLPLPAATGRRQRRVSKIYGPENKSGNLHDR